MVEIWIQGDMSYDVLAGLTENLVVWYMYEFDKWTDLSQCSLFL
jgi:hypothetical protein